VTETLQGAEKARFVSAMFSRIARRYDLMNGLMTLGLHHAWRRVAARQTIASPEGPALDLATGTGDLAFAAARAGLRVVGCDFAPRMVAIAQGKLRQRAAAGACFHVARGEQLPYRDAAFDGAVSAFAMRNVKPVLPAVLGELRRVLRPGASLVVLEFSEPTLAPVRWGHALYTRVLVPRIGGLLTGDAAPFDYLNRSIDAWGPPQRFADELRAAGFADVGFRRLTLGTVALHWGRRPNSG
jgi:demethylmenaquinone methyltransferase/2-methoxy-6-polyprenyl-1,4-benzoquinol methylase